MRQGINYREHGEQAVRIASEVETLQREADRLDRKAAEAQEAYRVLRAEAAGMRMRAMVLGEMVDEVLASFEAPTGKAGKA